MFNLIYNHDTTGDVGLFQETGRSRRRVWQESAEAGSQHLGGIFHERWKGWVTAEHFDH